jgi:protein TonB
MALPFAAALAAHGAIAALLLVSAPRTLPGAAEWMNVELVAAERSAMPPGAGVGTGDAADAGEAAQEAPPEPAISTAPVPAPLSAPSTAVPSMAATPPARPAAERANVARPAPRAAVSGAASGGGTAPAAAGPSDDAVAAWKASLSGWIERHRRYPPAARFRGEEGVVLLRFRVDEEGRVLHVALERGSGSSVLDTAAISLLADARLPSPPPGLRPEQRSVSAPIRYRLE